MKLTKPQIDLLTKLNDGWEMGWSYDEQSYFLTENGAKQLVYTSTVRSLRDKGFLLNFTITPAGKLEVDRG